MGSQPLTSDSAVPPPATTLETGGVVTTVLSVRLPRLTQAMQSDCFHCVALNPCALQACLAAPYWALTLQLTFLSASYLHSSS